MSHGDDWEGHQDLLLALAIGYYLLAVATILMRLTITPLRGALIFQVIIGTLEAIFLFTDSVNAYRIIIGAIVPAVLLSRGVLVHVLVPYSRTPLVLYEGMNPVWRSFHPKGWILAVAVNLYGAAFRIWAAVVVGHGTGVLVAVLAILTLLTLVLCYRAYRSTAGAFTPKDRAWYPQYGPITDSPFTIAGASKPTFSRYIRMADGTHLAVDVYLPFGPNGDPTATPHPVYLNQTRYNRLWCVAKPYSHILGDRYNLRSMRYVNTFLPRGYAVVAVDVRGTGASGGSRPVDLSPAEIADYVQVVDWISAQPWCNGKIATGGISYDALTGLKTAAAAKGKVQAVFALFTPVDMYCDIALPGGVQCAGFTDTYTSFTTAVEYCRTPTGFPIDSRFMRTMLQSVVSGMAPVNGDFSRRDQAVQEHVEGNWNLAKTLRVVFTKDDRLNVAPSASVSAGAEEKGGRGGRGGGGGSRGSSSVSVGTLGPQPEDLAALKRYGVAVMSYSGYFDSGSVRAAARLYEGLAGDDGILPPGSRFVVGPWQHGARAQCSPFSWTGPNPDRVNFDMYADVGNWVDIMLDSSVSQVATATPSGVQESKAEEGVGGGGGGGGGDSGDDAVTAEESQTTPFESSLMVRETMAAVLDVETPVHYFVMGTEQWMGSQEWPFAAPLPPAGSIAMPEATGPSQCQYDVLFLGNGTLSTAESELSYPSSPASLRFPVDADKATTGLVSRWNLVQHLLMQPVKYDDRLEASQFLLTFESPPLLDDYTVSGCPTLDVIVEILDGGTDVALFAYLEDVAPKTGAVHYITEGVIRAGHGVEHPYHGNPTRPPSCTRSFRAADLKPLSGPTAVPFTMEPVSHTFAVGHSIRCSIGLADQGNFLTSTIPNVAKRVAVRVGVDSVDGMAGRGAREAAVATRRSALWLPLDVAGHGPGSRIAVSGDSVAVSPGEDFVGMGDITDDGAVLERMPVPVGGVGGVGGVGSGDAVHHLGSPTQL